MPVFHIHQWCGDEYIEDIEGYRLPNLEAARAEAQAGARSLLGEEACHGRFNLNQRFEITDAGGVHRLTVRFEDVVEIDWPRDAAERQARTSG